MAKDLLLEIGMEEVPARFVRAAVESASRIKSANGLNAIHIEHRQVECLCNTSPNCCSDSWCCGEANRMSMKK